MPTETALRRVLREAGARVVPNMRLCDAGVPQVRDDRAIEAVAFGLPCGVPGFADITLVSPLKADGSPAYGADQTEAAAAAAALEAEHRKRITYPELATSPDARPRDGQNHFRPPMSFPSLARGGQGCERTSGKLQPINACTKAGKRRPVLET